MSRLFTSTRGLCSWRNRLASPDKQWKRKYSAFETAVSWEAASSSASGLPKELETLLRTTFDDPMLLLAVAEHKVDLVGGNAASQSDVWAVINTSRGLLSLTVEAKALESFGNETLERWLGGTSEQSIKNRKDRWEHVRANLPATESYLGVRYQMLHRCASAVIEAKRLGASHAAFVVQAFNTPKTSFREFEKFCSALDIPAGRGSLAVTTSNGISLAIGWIDCPLATDATIATCA
jgi:hypothetical protein